MSKIFVTCAVVCVLCLTACNSTRIDSTDIVTSNSRTAGQLEATVTELDRTVSDSRSRIANIVETGRNIEDGVERLEYLFNEYEREVDRLLKEIDAIRDEAAQASNVDTGGDNTDSAVPTDTSNTDNTETEVQDRNTLLAEYDSMI